MTQVPAFGPVAEVRAGAFDLHDRSAYLGWRERKLADYPVTAEGLMVPVADAAHPTDAEHAQLTRICRKVNAAIYASRAPLDKSDLRRLGEEFGLRRLDDNLCADEDSVTSLRVVAGGRHQEYVPYTNRPLSWHTDGYYNRPDARVRAILMHCASPAASGGESALLDHEIAYILLRDANPAFIEAFMHPEAMTIPANVENGIELRAAQTGPVYSVDPGTGRLHMRYTARQRNIHWRPDPITRSAVAFLQDLLASDLPQVFRWRLQAGEGILCNNVLHSRSGFEDAPGQQRLLYRARYYDRIAAT